MGNKKSVSIEVAANAVHAPKFVSKANQWCVTEMKSGKQLQYWFSKEDQNKAEKKYEELTSA